MLPCVTLVIFALVCAKSIEAQARNDYIQCGGTAGLCRRYVCEDKEWPGAKICQGARVCVRDSAAYWHCRISKEYEKYVKPIERAPVSAPAPEWTKRVCLFADTGFAELDFCVSADARVDHVVPKGIRSIRFPHTMLLLVQCDGRLASLDTDVADLNMLCDGRRPLYWKVVPQTAVSQYRNKLLIYPATETDDFSASLNNKAVKQFASDAPDALSWWSRWLSHGQMELQLDAQVIDAPLTDFNRSTTTPLKHRPLCSHIRSNLPKKGEYDGVFIFWNSMDGNDNLAADEATTEDGLYHNRFACSAITPRSKQSLESAWDGATAGLLVHAWLDQVRVLMRLRNATVIPSMDPKTLGVDADSGAGLLMKPGQWLFFYRHVMLNTNNNGIPLDIWKSGTIRTHVKGLPDIPDFKEDEEIEEEKLDEDEQIDEDE